VSAWDLLLVRRIDELHLEAPYYGTRHLAKQLRREGHEDPASLRVAETDRADQNRKAVIPCEAPYRFVGGPAQARRFEVHAIGPVTRQDADEPWT
jgi:hypothetical protein